MPTSYDPPPVHAKTNRRLLVVALVAGCVITAGVVFYHFVENLSWLNAFYFSVVTLTTVGYGDITPQTELGKLFTTFYILIGVGIIATSLNILVRGAAESQLERRLEHRRHKK